MISASLPRTAAVVTLTLLSLGAAAQESPSPVQCGTKAAQYRTASAKGPKLWVLRHGEMTRDNPLRPLTPERLVVLQVVVNGRLASAFGPDHDHLQQGGAVQDLERDGEPIRWAAGPDGLPPSLRVVAEDGRVLIDGLRFAECEAAPKARAVPPAARAPSADAPNRKAAEERSRPRPGLPSGAMEGLTLPGRGGEP